MHMTSNGKLIAKLSTHVKRRNMNMNYPNALIMWKRRQQEQSQLDYSVIKLVRWGIELLITNKKQGEGRLIDQNDKGRPFNEIAAFIREKGINNEQ